MPTATRHSVSLAALAALGLVGLAAFSRWASASPQAPAAGGRKSWVLLGSGARERVSLEGGRALILSVQTSSSDSYERLAARYLAPPSDAAVLRKANPGRPALRAGSWCRIPAGLLAPAWREKALRAAFPLDAPSSGGWIHRPGASPLDTYGEGAWEASAWFTGDGKNFTAILKANRLSDPVLPPGEEIVIPRALLIEPYAARCDGIPGPQPDTSGRVAGGGGANRPAAKGAAAARDERDEGDEETEAAELRENAARGELTFSHDAEGSYASYRIKRGEALYSAVVVRFTGRVDPEDVSAAAAEIARRSGIVNIANIPVGHEVKIPAAILLPEFLPAQDQRRQAVDRTRREAAKVKNPVRSRNLQGIHVILDAGHGGIDPGALIGGVAEHEYAYDVLCRVKRILETETSAIVHPTIEDPDSRFEPQGAVILPIGGEESILTSPSHVNGAPGETALGVNLRWYLANAIQRRLVASGVKTSRIVFASFHADVLHASLRGAMVYVPGEQYRRGTYTCRSRDCSRYEEVREAPAVHFDRADRVASEGLSREFAADLIAAFRKRGIRVHPYEPIRDRIIRDGNAWLPAVLRGNGVPVKVLVELANLNNTDDRSLMQSAVFRETLARAFTDALLRYYKSPAPPPAGSRIAATRAGG